MNKHDTHAHPHPKHKAHEEAAKDREAVDQESVKEAKKTFTAATPKADAPATKFKSDDRVLVTCKDHERVGQVAVVQSVPAKAPEDKQRYDLITLDSRHQFSVTEDRVELA